MNSPRALATCLRHVSPTVRPVIVSPTRHVRFVNTDKEELGGVGGSEPPSPKRNPVNWKAGSITAVGVLLAGWWMMSAKGKKPSS